MGRSLGTGEDTCPRRRRDYFISYMYTIPRTLAAGRYTLRLTEKDLIADRSAAREVPIAIVRIDTPPGVSGLDILPSSHRCETMASIQSRTVISTGMGP
jgi:hypothetical protein